MNTPKILINIEIIVIPADVKNQQKDRPHIERNIISNMIALIIAPQSVKNIKKNTLKNIGNFQQNMIYGTIVFLFAKKLEEIQIIQN